MEDPPSALERRQWEKSPISGLLPAALLAEKGLHASFSSLDDVGGLYKILGASRTTSDDEMDQLVKKEVKGCRDKLYDLHPDRPGGDRDEFNEWRNKWDAEYLKAWKAVPESLIYKAWILGGYVDPTKNPDLQDPICTATILAASESERRDRVVQLVEREMGAEVVSDFVNQTEFDGSDDEDDHYSINEALEANKRSQKEHAWVEEPEDGASALKPGDTVLFYFEWGWERSQHQKEMAESYTTPVLVRYVIDGDYILQDFGSEFDALYLPREDFNELCSGKTEASLDVLPKSWCIVKLE